MAARKLEQRRPFFLWRQFQGRQRLAFFEQEVQPWFVEIPVVFVGQLLGPGRSRFAEPFLLEFLEDFVAEVEVGYRPFLGKAHDAKAGGVGQYGR